MILATKKLRHLQPTKIISSTNTLPTLFLNSPSNRIKLTFKRSRVEINSTIDLSAQIIQVGGLTIHPTTFCRSPPTRCNRHKSISNTPSTSNNRKEERRRKEGRKSRSKDPKTFRASREAARSNTRLSINIINVRRSSAFARRRSSSLSPFLSDRWKEARKATGWRHSVEQSRDKRNRLSLSLSLSQQGVLRPRYAAIQHTIRDYRFASG